MPTHRISDYVKYESRKGGFRLLTRAGTERTDHFGDAGVVSLTDEEARELYGVLKERYEEDF